MTLFYSKQENLSVRVAQPVSDPSQLPVSMFQNDRSLKIKGLELEAKITFADNWLLTGGMTTQSNQEGSGIDDFTLAADWEARIGLAYSGSWFSVGLYDIVTSKFPESSVRNPAAVANLNPDSKTFHRISINTRFDLSRYMPGATLKLYVQNLLDDNFYLPSGFAGGFDANSVPSEGGRKVWAEIGVQF